MPSPDGAAPAPAIPLAPDHNALADVDPNAAISMQDLVAAGPVALHTFKTRYPERFRSLEEGAENDRRARRPATKVPASHAVGDGVPPPEDVPTFRALADSGLLRMNAFREKHPEAYARLWQEHLARYRR